MKLTLILVVFFAVAEACTSSSSNTPQATTSLGAAAAASASVGAGSSCTASEGKDASLVPGAVGFSPGGYRAYGDGPIYPAFVPSDGASAAVLRFDDLGEASWLGANAPGRIRKVLWIAPPDFHGDVVVRALATSPRTEFGHLNEAPTDAKRMSIPGDAGGYIFFSARGCYHLRIDAPNSATVVTIEIR